MAALLVLATVALLAPALATAGHPYLSSIYRFVDKPGQFEYFENPCGLTVDASGNVYVSDYYDGDVDVFTSGGSLLTRLLDADPVDGPGGLAVAASGRLFVNEYHRQVLSYAPAAFPLASKTAFGAPTTVDVAHPTGVAYDPLGNRVYVNDRSYVSVYDASGSPVMNGPEPLRIGAGTLEDAYGVAVSAFPGTAGYVYVAEAANDTIEVFDPSVSLEVPVASIDGRGTPQGGFPTLRDAALAIDNSNGHLYVSYNAQGPFYEHPRAWVAEFNAAGEHRGGLASPTPIWFGSPNGIAVDNSAQPTQGRVYVTTGNSEMESAGVAPEKPEESAVYAFGPGSAGQRLEVTPAGTGAGRVTSAPAGIACPGACAAEFDLGATVTLSAAPGPGASFEGWSGGGCAGTGACVVTLVAATSVTAEFQPAPAPAGAPRSASLSATEAGAGPRLAAAAAESVRPAAGEQGPARARQRRLRNHRRHGKAGRHRHKQTKSGGKANAR